MIMLFLLITCYKEKYMFLWTILWYVFHGYQSGDQLWKHAWKFAIPQTFKLLPNNTCVIHFSQTFMIKKSEYKNR